MRSRALIAATVARAALAASCGGDDDPVVAGSPTSRPTGAGEVVVQVLVDGGFVPVELALTTVPTVTVMGDGAVITPAAVPAIYPGPALPPLQVARATARQVDDLVRRGQELGLLGGPLEFGQPPVADAPNTTVTITAAGRTHRHVAYALDISDDQPVPGRPGLGPREVANRRALSDFVKATSELPPGSEAWRPSAVAVYDLGPYQADPQLPQRALAWPLGRAPSGPPSASGAPPCLLVEGDDLAKVLDATGRANARTPWTISGSNRALAFRPVVPGQPGCPA